MRASPNGDGDVDGARAEARVAGDGRLNLVQPRGTLGAAAAALGFLTRSPRQPESPPLNPAPPQVSIQAAHRAAVEKQQKEAVARHVLLPEEAAIKQLQLQRAENAMRLPGPAPPQVSARAAAAVAAATAAVTAREDMMLAAVAAEAAATAAAAARRAAAVWYKTQQKEAVARQVLSLQEVARKATVARQLQQAEVALLATAFKAWAVPLRTARAARAVEAAQRHQQLRVTQAAQAAAAVAAAKAAARAREDMMRAEAGTALIRVRAKAAAALEHTGDSGDTGTECEVVSERSLDAVLEENKKHAKCTGDFFDFTGDGGAEAGGGWSETIQIKEDSNKEEEVEVEVATRHVPPTLTATPAGPTQSRRKISIVDDDDSSDEDDREPAKTSRGTPSAAEASRRRRTATEAMKKTGDEAFKCGEIQAADARHADSLTSPGGTGRREGTAAEEPEATAGTNAGSAEVISPKLPTAAAVVLSAAPLTPAAALNADVPTLTATATIDAAVSTDTHRRSDRLKALALTEAAIAAAAAIDKIIILD